MNTLLIFFIFVPILALILLGLNLLLAPSKPDEEKVSPYECGFGVLTSQTRQTFQIHFFVVALLFLIFDLEILLLFPVGVTLYNVSFYGFTVAMIFFIVLTIGFVLEIGSGAVTLTNYDGTKLSSVKKENQSSNITPFPPINNKRFQRWNLFSSLNLKLKGKLSRSISTSSKASNNLFYQKNDNKFSILSIMVPSKDKSQIFAKNILFSKTIDFTILNQFILENLQSFYIRILNNSRKDVEIIIFNI